MKEKIKYFFYCFFVCVIAYLLLNLIKGTEIDKILLRDTLIVSLVISAFLTYIIKR